MRLVQNIFRMFHKIYEILLLLNENHAHITAYSTEHMHRFLLNGMVPKEIVYQKLA